MVQWAPPTYDPKWGPHRVNFHFIINCSPSLSKNETFGVLSYLSFLATYFWFHNKNGSIEKCLWEIRKTKCLLTVQTFMHMYNISLKMKKKLLWEKIHKFFSFTKMQRWKGQKSMWLFFLFLDNFYTMGGICQFQIPTVHTRKIHGRHFLILVLYT